jgi:hypothetical protein
MEVQMGLDSFWRHPDGKEVKDPEFDPPLQLCGGMFSANGQGSFRGKVYNDLIQSETGVSLYQELIPNSTVQKMAAKLALMETEDEEATDLVRMFLAYGSAGFDLLGWW